MKQIKSFFAIIFFLLVSLLLSSHFEVQSADAPPELSATNDSNVPVNLQVTSHSGGNRIVTVPKGDSISLPNDVTEVKVLPDPLSKPPAEGLKVDVKVDKTGTETVHITEMLKGTKWKTVQDVVAPQAAPAATTTSEKKYEFNWQPYIYDQYTVQPIKLDYEYLGTEGTLEQQSGKFAKLDAIDDFNYRTLVMPKGNGGCNGVSESAIEDEVDDLVDDYFDWEISYEELEYRLDQLGYGLDWWYGPYKYEEDFYWDGKIYGCSISRIRLQNIYSSHAYPEVAGIQYDRFDLINPDFRYQDA